MRRTWHKPQKVKEKAFYSNRQIRVPEVFVIDENGVQIGAMPTAKALQMAEDAGLDLVEVNPVGKPPVVKIMDYGQFKYEKDKAVHRQKQQQKKVDTKAVRLSARISKHDFEFRAKQGDKFLTQGNKLKIELVLKGRERQHPQKARELIEEFVAIIAQNEKLNLVREQDLTVQGGRFTMVLINKV